jgi:hypothetical protein
MIAELAAGEELGSNILCVSGRSLASVNVYGSERNRIQLIVSVLSPSSTLLGAPSSPNCFDGNFESRMGSTSARANWARALYSAQDMQILSWGAPAKQWAMTTSARPSPKSVTSHVG